MAAESPTIKNIMTRTTKRYDSLNEGMAAMLEYFESIIKSGQRDALPAPDFIEASIGIDNIRYWRGIGEAIAPISDLKANALWMLLCAIYNNGHQIGNWKIVRIADTSPMKFGRPLLAIRLGDGGGLQEVDGLDVTDTVSGTKIPEKIPRFKVVANGKKYNEEKQGNQVMRSLQYDVEVTGQIPA